MPQLLRRVARVPGLTEGFFDLDKAHELVSLLLGCNLEGDGDQPWPAAGAVYGGRLLGGQQVAQASQGVTVFRLTADEVADVAEFLQAQSLDALLGALGQDCGVVPGRRPGRPGGWAR
ncbi:MAG: DUF1877 family protein [Streptosporangiaceae bacterium]